MSYHNIVDIHYSATRAKEIFNEIVARIDHRTLALVIDEITSSHGIVAVVKVGNDGSEGVPFAQNVKAFRILFEHRSGAQKILHPGLGHLFFPDVFDQLDTKFLSDPLHQRRKQHDSRLNFAEALSQDLSGHIVHIFPEQGAKILQVNQVERIIRRDFIGLFDQ